MKSVLKTLKIRQILDHLFLFLGVFLIPLLVTPSLQDNYTVVKWKTVHILTFLLLIQLLIKKAPLSLPNLGRPICYGLAAIFALWGWEHYFHQLPFLSVVTVDRIGFMGLVLFFYSRIKEGPQTLNVIGYALMASMAVFMIALNLKGLISWETFFKGTYSAKYLEFSFGNRNMAAQFFGLTCLFSIRYMSNQTHTWGRVLGGIFIALTLILLIKTTCRSMFLGLLAGTGLYALFHFRESLRKPVLKIAILGGIVGMGILIYKRPITIQHRFDMWTNALKIAKDYPLGVGRERFSFYNVLYQEAGQICPRKETLVEHTPHNEVMKHLAEEGFLLIAIALGILLLFIRNHGPTLWQGLEKSEPLKFSLALLTLLISECLFQFPMEVALPHLMIACAVGGILAHLKEHTTLKFPLVLRMILIAAYGTGAFFVLLSNLAYGAMANNIALTHKICHHMPLSWRACSQHGKNLNAMRQYQASLDQSLKNLELRPYNHMDIMQVGRAYINMKQRALSCKFAHYHDRLFFRQSRLKPFVVKHCPESEQSACLKRPIKEHYRALFDHLPQEQQKRLLRHT